MNKLLDPSNLHLHPGWFSPLQLLKTKLQDYRPEDSSSTLPTQFLEDLNKELREFLETPQGTPSTSNGRDLLNREVDERP